MIDTYVYFVSYQTLFGIHKLIENKVINLDRIVKSEYDVHYLQTKTRLDFRLKTCSLINFQLLDSYNKEEREGKDV